MIQTYITLKLYMYTFQTYIVNHINVQIVQEIHNQIQTCNLRYRCNLHYHVKSQNISIKLFEMRICRSEQCKHKIMTKYQFVIHPQQQLFPLAFQHKLHQVGVGFVQNVQDFFQLKRLCSQISCGCFIVIKQTFGVIFNQILRTLFLGDFQMQQAQLT